MNTKMVLATVENERSRQDAKWGVQNHHIDKWFSILMEEIGEACKESLEGNAANCCDELIQASAVCVAMVECIYRNRGIDGSAVDIQLENKKLRDALETLSLAARVLVNDKRITDPIVIKQAVFGRDPDLLLNAIHGLELALEKATFPVLPQKDGER